MIDMCACTRFIQACGVPVGAVCLAAAAWPASAASVQGGVAFLDCGGGEWPAFRRAAQRGIWNGATVCMKRVGMQHHETQKLHVLNMTQVWYEASPPCHPAMDDEISKLIVWCLQGIWHGAADMELYLQANELIERWTDHGTNTLVNWEQYYQGDELGLQGSSTDASYIDRRSRMHGTYRFVMNHVAIDRRPAGLPLC